MTGIKLEKRFPHIPDEDVTRIFQDGYMKGWENARKKAIPIELYEQVKGERDVAIEQLKALNIELFEKPYLKAITIEWLNKRAKEIAFAYWTNARNKITLPLNELPLLIDQIIREWEKENETN